ncbi:flavin reductase (DIM6/NTAB) family NADH-FMN oxidoreductase RutF [Haloactinopolyspora alba]|uniref:Flavin reductase (DIM6/NTAB) family NADH-FMN oxidoreductase RutF n=1 Tax=Haloactinopolyspora alba TaxID=648780 RepID=A0A2P8E946_9ACTN|nr:flavin reductase family protein [Haloactinopolyspora alba]PSL05974.1 flavin reductase (DIM6/NTAB) family NADH-FMN oxidoreductase RutF [Haloactinopolyspora alba]
MDRSGLHDTGGSADGDMALHQEQTVDSSILREVCGMFVTGVTVITSGREDTADGTTVNSFTSVSLDPPMVLFCLHRDSRLRPVIHDTGAYVVNFLAGPQERLARAFAGRASAAVQAEATRPSLTGVPVLSQALAFLSCQLVDELEGGDHVIFLARVVELGVLRRNQDPLIFFRGSLGALADEPLVSTPIWDG